MSNKHCCANHANEGSDILFYVEHDNYDYIEN